MNTRKSFILEDDTVGKIEEIEGVIHRKWGTYQIVHESSNVKIKRVVVNPNRCLSFQCHKHRSENWLVESGVAMIVQCNQPQEIINKINNSDSLDSYYYELTIDEQEEQSNYIDENIEVFTLTEHEYFTHDKLNWHQLINPTNTNLVIIETQYGTICDEDDIYRLYG